MADVADNAIRATMAYRGAVEDYGNFIDSTMRQYGWTMPDSSGKYSVLGAQDAFDPDRVIQFDSAGKPVFGPDDQQRLAAMGAMGQYGTTGLFAETAQTGAAGEAAARAEARSRGLGAGSGLSRQAELASEVEAAQAIGEVSAGLFGDILGKYGGLGKMYQDIAVGEATDAAIRASEAAQNISLSNPVTEPMMSEDAAAPAAPAAPATPDEQQYKTGDTMPATNRGNYTVPGKPGGHSGKPGKPGEIVVGSGGVRWVYRPNGPKGPNWYKKG